MLITEYVQILLKIVEAYSKTGFIITSEIKIDARTQKIGLIKVIIEFADDSKLFVTEYIDLRYKVDKLTYSFHYQDKDRKMIFRYDNALHKPALGFKEHKHFKGEILPFDIPDLKDVLEDIISEFLRK
ncbi:MAG: DUF6516 family protein [Candidatus Scalindua sp.]|nr:DUF6516 family protein [Candidatus Scalindua sp.]